MGQTYKKHTGTFVEAIERLTLTMPTAPDDPDGDNAIALEWWKLQIRKYDEQTEAYNGFLTNLHSIVMGQCTDALADKIKSHIDYATANQDGIYLLRIIKQLTYSFEDRHKLSDALCDVMEGFYKLRQGDHEMLQDYYEQFKSHVGVMDEVGVVFAGSSLVGEVALSNGQGTATNSDHDEAHNQAITIRFIRGSNCHHQAYLH